MSVEELEILRKKANKIKQIGTLITVIAIILGFILTKSFVLIFFVLILGLLITTFLASGPTRKFVLAFKQTFVLKSLQSVFTDLVYKPEKGLPEFIIRDTQMMDMGDRYSSNDYFSGKYKDITVIQSDVHIEEEHTSTDSDGTTTTSWVTIFKGKWMIFDFNKTFKNNIQVCQKGFGNSKLSNWNSEMKYKKVMMEDQQFNKDFVVYSRDEHEAFYILTPALIEKIKNLSNSISGRLLFCFIDNKLHIGLYDGKDSFEPNIHKKVDEEKIINEINKDIKLITNFVDELNLDNDLFRKEV